MPKNERFFLIIIVALSALLLFMMNNRFLTVVNHDSAIFCLLAQSIAQGYGYLLFSEPTPVPYFTFPPMLPFLLAGLLKMLGTTDLEAAQEVFKGFIHLLFLGSIPLFYLWLRRGIDTKPAMALTILLALNPLIFKYGSDVLSDVPFWAFSMAAIYCFARWEESNKSSWFWIMILAIAVSALTRQIGLALILAFAIQMLLKRQWKPLVLMLLSIGLVMGSWYNFEHHYRKTHQSHLDTLNQIGTQEVLKKSPIKLEYVKHFVMLNPLSHDKASVEMNPVKLLEAGVLRFQEYHPLFLNQLLPPIKIRDAEGVKFNIMTTWPFVFLFWWLVFLGTKRTWETHRMAVLYVGAYLGVLLVYPYVSARFLLPVFPFITLFLYHGLSALLSLAPQQHERIQWQRVVAIALFLFVLIGGHLLQTVRWVNAGFQLKIADQGPSRREGNQGFYQTLVWAKGNLPKDSLLISRKPPVTYFYSGLKSTAFPFTSQQEKLGAFLQEQQTLYGKQFSKIYILEDTAFGESTRYLSPFIQNKQNAQHFSLIYTDPKSGSRIWQLH